MSARRRFVSTASIVSLIALAATLVFWHRSLRLSESAQICWPPRGKIMIASLDGRIGFAFQRANAPIEYFHSPSAPTVSGFHSHPRSFDPYAEWGATLHELIPKVFEFNWKCFTFGRNRGAVALAVPTWVVVLITLIFPLRDVLRMVTVHRRRAKGLCALCGYDLRHSVDRCPECGTVIEPFTPEEIPPKSSSAVTSDH